MKPIPVLMRGNRLVTARARAAAQPSGRGTGTRSRARKRARSSCLDPRRSRARRAQLRYGRL